MESSSHLQTKLVQSMELTKAGLQARYRKTWIGFIWVILNPIILLIIQGVVFSNILNVKFDRYIFYLVAGVIPWIFMSQCLEMGTSYLKSMAGTIKAFSVDPLVIITAQVTENSINFLTILVIIVSPMAFYLDKSIVFIPQWILGFVSLYVATLSLTFLAATTNVIFRDLRYIVSFILTVTYFLTPILYSADQLPAKIRAVLILNPFYLILMPFQTSGGAVAFSDWLVILLKAYLTAGLFYLLARYNWKRIKNSFYLNL